jgi:IS5 family transposase
MVLANGTGIPLTCSTHSAERAEVKLAAETVDQACHTKVPTPLIADKGYDSDELRDEMAEKNVLLISSHRQNRKHTSRQDGRRMRRYSRRWIVERTISWIGQFRRRVVRYEYHSQIDQALIQLACGYICLRRFGTRLYKELCGIYRNTG